MSMATAVRAVMDLITKAQGDYVFELRKKSFNTTRKLEPM